MFAAALDAFSVRDLDALEQFFDNEIEWEPTLTAGAPPGTIYRGREGMRLYLHALDREFEDLCLEVEGFDEVAGNRLLYRGRVTGRARASGVALDVPVWALWEIRNEQLFRGWSFFSEREALEAVKSG